MLTIYGMKYKSYILHYISCLVAGFCLYYFGVPTVNLAAPRVFSNTDTLKSIPEGKPLKNDASIATALAIYSIQIPKSVLKITYDEKLEERGLTERKSLFEVTLIKIGPAAFQSWALLGSTLAHEIEVHANQNVLVIILMDKLGFDATQEAERMAYLYELKHASRFQLTAAEALDIDETMNYFYPLKNGPICMVKEGHGCIKPLIRNWVAQQIVNVIIL